MHEFARVLRAIIHGAVQIIKTPRPLVCKIIDFKIKLLSLELQI
jgi:hypothetical protein